MKRAFVLAAALLMVATWAQAEKTDMSTITCEELLHTFPEDAIVVGAWMSGYWNAARNQETLDLNRYKANSKRVSIYCKKHPKQTVMATIQKVAQ